MKTPQEIRVQVYNRALTAFITKGNAMLSHLQALERNCEDRDLGNECLLLAKRLRELTVKLVGQTTKED